MIGGIYRDAPAMPHNSRDFRLTPSTPEVVAQMAEIVPQEAVEAMLGTGEGTDTPQAAEPPTEPVEPPQPTSPGKPAERVKREYKRRA